MSNDKNLYIELPQHIRESIRDEAIRDEGTLYDEVRFANNPLIMLRTKVRALMVKTASDKYWENQRANHNQGVLLDAANNRIAELEQQVERLSQQIGRLSKK